MKKKVQKKNRSTRTVIKLPPPSRYRRSHKELLAEIGEINGITLHGLEGDLRVTIEIYGHEVEVIRDYHSADGITDHHTTRLGIAEALNRADDEHFQKMFVSRRLRTKARIARANKQNAKRKAVRA